MTHTWRAARKLWFALACLAVAWLLVSPVVTFVQQGEISHLQHQTAQRGAQNQTLLKRLATDEHVVTIEGNFIANDLAWQNAIVGPLCALSVHHACPPPPQPPDFQSQGAP